jgi:hypothetical protein
MNNSLPGWAQRRPAAPGARYASPAGSAADATGLAGLSHRVQKACAYIDARISELTPDALDVGTTDIFDGYIEELGKTWECDDDQRHAAEIEDLQRRIAAAQEQVMAAEHAVRIATAAVDVTRQDWVAARARLGAPPLPTTPGLPAVTQPADAGNCTTMSSLPQRRRRTP